MRKWREEKRERTKKEREQRKREKAMDQVVTDMVCDFFVVLIHTVLRERGVYPKASGPLELEAEQFRWWLSFEGSLWGRPPRVCEEHSHGTLSSSWSYIIYLWNHFGSSQTDSRGESNWSNIRKRALNSNAEENFKASIAITTWTIWRSTWGVRLSKSDFEIGGKKSSN